MTNGNDGKAGQRLSDRLTFAWFQRQAVLGRKLHQQEVADLVGKELHRAPLSAAAVSKWLSGESEPSLDTIKAVAKVLKVEPGWLAFGEGDDPPDPMTPTPMPRQK